MGQMGEGRGGAILLRELCGLIRRRLAVEEVCGARVGECGVDEGPLSDVECTSGGGGAGAGGRSGRLVSTRESTRDDCEGREGPAAAAHDIVAGSLVDLEISE